MNIYVTSAIAGLKEKLNGYVALLNYRYTNLCVKAELGALLPVTVIADKEYNLEDVAVVFTPTEYQFDIHPKLRDYLQPIIDGIFDVHPEFKLEIQQVEKVMTSETSICSTRCRRWTTTAMTCLKI